MVDPNLLIGLSMLTTGLVLGAIFALTAAGVTIVYGCIWLPNAASGQFFLLAPLVAWSLSTAMGWSPILAVAAVLVAGLPFAYLLERLLIRRFYDVPDRNIAYFVVTLGITQILSGVFSITWGQWSDQYNIPPLAEGVVFIGPFPLPANRLIALVGALALLGALFVGLRYHRFGRALRAVFQNREAAALRGVDVQRIYLGAFLLGTSVIFAGGLLYAMAYSFDLSVAWSMGITAFAIMIVGGPGSVLGALVVGMLFGFVQAAVSVFASPTAATLSYLLAMLVILLLRPSGLFAR
ncbi:MAG: branched-chain amino acid ABC transporter permease [Xanthobacteraceae bacterium]|nr:branched-chain amino acid ABC transporter permease [Xanthobacteraceae bacterium]